MCKIIHGKIKGITPLRGVTTAVLIFSTKRPLWLRLENSTTTIGLVGERCFLCSIWQVNHLYCRSFHRKRPFLSSKDSHFCPRFLGRHTPSCWMFFCVILTVSDNKIPMRNRSFKHGENYLKEPKSCFPSVSQRHEGQESSLQNAQWRDRKHKTGKLYMWFAELSCRPCKSLQRKRTQKRHNKSCHNTELDSLWQCNKTCPSCKWSEPRSKMYPETMMNSFV